MAVGRLVPLAMRRTLLVCAIVVGLCWDATSRASANPRDRAVGATFPMPRPDDLSIAQEGMGVDIPSIDPDVIRLDTSIRPDEIGTPWDIPSPGSFIDGHHKEQALALCHAAAVVTELAVGDGDTDGDAFVQQTIREAVEFGRGFREPPAVEVLADLVELIRDHGTDYLWGGSSPETGFDCSAPVEWASFAFTLPCPSIEPASSTSTCRTKPGRSGRT